MYKINTPFPSYYKIIKLNSTKLNFKGSSLLNLYNLYLKHFFFTQIPLKYSFNLVKNMTQNYLLMLNFKRKRFFPLIKSKKNEVFISLSMGLFSPFFKKGKYFLKSKLVYITTALFLRKVLLFSDFKEMYLLINKIPKYFSEILNTINEPTINLYKNPFTNLIVNEQNLNNNFVFPYIFFTNNKPYGLLKVKQKGRLKRKIEKKIITMNRMLD